MMRKEIKKSVLSIGDTNKERIIKNVAAGKVSNDSTDAINGSQLYAVTEEFSKLALNVLGAEANDTNGGFKAPEFTQLKKADSGNEDKATTFVGAINKNTAKINEGLKFGITTSTQTTTSSNTPITKQLGSTLNFAGDKYITPSIDSSNNIKYSLTVAEKIEENTTQPSEAPKPDPNDKLVTGAVVKTYVDGKISSLSSTLDLEADNTKNVENEKDKKSPKGKVDLKTQTLSIKGDENITTSVEDSKNTVSIELKDALTGIKTIELKDGKSIHSKTIAVNENGNLVVREDNGKKQNVENTIITSGNIGDQLITYKSNGGKTTNGKEFTVKLKNGFDFKNTDNITATVGENGEVTHKLNSELKEIGSISSSKDAKGAKITLTPVKDGKDSKIEFTLGTNGGIATKYEFNDEGLDLANKQIKKLASGIGTDTTTNVNNVLSGNNIDTIQSNAVNVKDLSDVAKAIIAKGIQIEGNELTTRKDGKQEKQKETLQLGSTIVIESSESVNGKSKNSDGTTQDQKFDDIKISIKKDASTNNVKLKLDLKKSTTVSEEDERVVTSKAVAEKLKGYTTTTQLSQEYLKITGENIGTDEATKNKGKTTFGSNVGISEIKLGDTDKSTTELVQANALINYLKGTGDNSVKISDSPETKAEGTNSISIGTEALTQNTDSIAIGYYTTAKNRKSIVIGSESEVSSEQAISIGSNNSVSGKYSVALGEENNIIGQKSYALGAFNTIKGNDVYVLGSNITVDNTINDAIVLGNESKGVSNAVSVGNETNKRRIVFVADPTQEYDAANKKYVDARGIKFKGTKVGETGQLVNLDKTLTIDSSEAKYKEKKKKKKKKK